jgi:segregation and condensation protein B
MIEAVLLVAGRPMPVAALLEAVTVEGSPINTADIQAALLALQEDYQDRAVELREGALGYRLQTKKEYAACLSAMTPQKPVRYSKATLETLAIIAYRQPVTRAEIEQIRGVTVSSPIIRTLLDREWIRVVGHREIPGRPAVYATTAQFLADLNLKRLDELPALVQCVAPVVLSESEPEPEPELESILFMASAVEADEVQSACT